MYSKNTMLLHITDLSSEPLHAQISRQIRSMVFGDILTENDPLPSIRKMAREQKVSVITVQRAYEDLDREGIIYSKRGKGFFVAKLTQKQKQKMASVRFVENLQPVIREALEGGLDEVQILDVVRGLLNSSTEGGAK